MDLKLDHFEPEAGIPLVEQATDAALMCIAREGTTGGLWKITQDAISGEAFTAMLMIKYLKARYLGLPGHLAPLP